MAPLTSSGKRKEKFVRWKEAPAVERTEATTVPDMSSTPSSTRKVASVRGSPSTAATKSQFLQASKQLSVNEDCSVQRMASMRRGGTFPQQKSKEMNHAASSIALQHRGRLSSTEGGELHTMTTSEACHARHARPSQTRMKHQTPTEDVVVSMKGPGFEDAHSDSPRTYGRTLEVQRQEMQTRRGGPSTKSAEKNRNAQQGMSSVSRSMVVASTRGPATASSSQVSENGYVGGHRTSQSFLNSGGQSSPRRSITPQPPLSNVTTGSGKRRRPLTPISLNLQQNPACSATADVVDKVQDVGLNPEEYEETVEPTGFAELEPENATSSFYSGDRSTDMSGDSEEEGEYEGPPAEDAVQDYGMSIVDADGIAYPTETEKRRERRHDLAARMREGNRRQAEGRPRNYLLVDDYTHEPYGQGKGSWRKELMLLSRSLDPSVGNINRQPEDAVKEIAEWIQLTWEYSRPVKWEYVKDVIARGVSLRRSELWKKIRMKEDKPEGMSDRTWRSLGRQLESPSMMKKFENCSKANACRTNFGRTGPSGEVGVRERLRKKLKRSPSPEEVRSEMARPKGYAGHSKRDVEVDNVMHGSGVPVLSIQNQRNIHLSGNGRGGGVESSSTIKNCAGGERGVLPSAGVMSLSAEEVAQHPAFIHIMERLQALEKTQHGHAIEDDNPYEDGLVGEPTEETSEQSPTHEEVAREVLQDAITVGVRRGRRLTTKSNA